jgi:actin-related protein
MADVPVVVMDNGSAVFRAGYPSESAPRVLIPSLVGQPRNKGVAMAGGFREYEVGYGALHKRGVLDCSQPVRGGVIQDWADMERLWSHTIYKELRIAPENYCFVISEPTNNSTRDKEKTLEMMMETFNAKSMYLGSTAVLALYAYGLTTGVVVDCGLDVSNAVPVHEGYPLSRHMASSKVAGDALTMHLSKLLNAKGYGFSTQTEREVVNKVKETLVLRPGR